jgi:hypothetical protein
MPAGIVRGLLAPELAMTMGPRASDEKPKATGKQHVVIVISLQYNTQNNETKMFLVDWWYSALASLGGYC